jgi:hypothetical protein
MRGVWKHNLSHCADSSDYEEESVTEELTNTARELGLYELHN